jgi:signal transduction histidine kinase
LDIQGSLFQVVQSLVLIGAVIMLLSVINGRRIIGHVNEKYRVYWWVLLGLMVFFFFGYLFSFIAIQYRVGPLRIVLPVIVGVVFFFGSVFVYLVVRIGYNTIKDMENSIVVLKDAVSNREALEAQVSSSRDKLARQNDALNDLTRNILGKNNLRESACQLSEKTSQILDVGRVSIWLYDKDKTYIACTDAYERAQKRHSEGEKLYKQDYPVYFKAIEANGAMDVYDVHSDPRTAEFSEAYFSPMGITSLLDIPVYQEGKLKGIICCEHTGEKRTWSIEEKSFGNSLADIMAISMETFDRRKTEKELEISLSLTKATIESTADGILVVDNEGRISGFNQQFIKMWHIPPEMANHTSDKEALAFVLEQLTDPDRFITKVKELYANPHLESSDYLEFKDGRVFERYSKPQVLHDEIIGRVWSFRDITRQKQDEEKIHQLNLDLENRVRVRTKEALALNEELKTNIKHLEMANKELEAFSYSVSHDLRAPLRAINGFINILEQKYAEAVGPEAKMYMGSISKNAKKMGQLIDDLLAFSRLGKKDLEKVKIDMNELVTEIQGEMNIQEWNPKTRIIKEDLLPMVGDRNLVKQAFYNIIGNAVKYSHTKEEPVIEISSHTNEGESVYVVKDNGVGFSMEYYNKLFKVFQRLNSSADFEGVGVGLAIVERIVTKHAGRVWAESKENEGATFYMAFPNNVEPSPLPPPPADSAAVKVADGKK